MVIDIASISVFVYKYVIHRIAISCGAGHAIGEKHHHLLCKSTFYLYLYCIYIVLLYLWSTCTNKMHVQFTVLYHIKVMTAKAFNTFHMCECLLGSPPPFVHNMTAPNFKSSSIQPEIDKNCCMRPSINNVYQ